MSTTFDATQQQAFHRAQKALEELLRLQRQVKACADELKAASHDTRTYEEVARRYVALLDDWDRANQDYAAVNDALLKLMYQD
jgi:hypothetical protein